MVYAKLKGGKVRQCRNLQVTKQEEALAQPPPTVELKKSTQKALEVQAKKL